MKPGSNGRSWAPLRARGPSGVLGVGERRVGSQLLTGLPLASAPDGPEGNSGKEPGGSQTEGAGAEGRRTGQDCHHFPLCLPCCKKERSSECGNHPALQLRPQTLLPSANKLLWRELTELHAEREPLSDPVLPERGNTTHHHSKAWHGALEGDKGNAEAGQKPRRNRGRGPPGPTHTCRHSPI